MEHLLQYSAIDIFEPSNEMPFDYAQSYDEYNGWGRLNAENALHLIDENHDNYKVIHIKINGANITSPSGCDDNVTSDNPGGCSFDFSSFPYSFENPQTGTIVTEFVDGFAAYESFKKTHTAPFQINLCDFGGDVSTDLVAFTDSNKKPFWKRISNAELNLWNDQIPTPPNTNSNVEITPQSDFIIESITMNTMGGCPIIEGVLKGYSYKVFTDNFTNGEEEFPHASDIEDVFTLSLLLENADNVDSEIEVNHIPDFSTSNRNLDYNHFSLNIFPNPTTRKTHIDYRINKSSDILIQIIGLNGQRIIEVDLPNQSSGNHSESLDLKALPSGIYFCKIQSEYEIVTQKIIKN